MMAKKKDIMKTEIYYIDMPIRLYNALKRTGEIKTIEDIYRYDAKYKEGILTAKNLGLVSLKDLNSILSNFNLPIIKSKKYTNVNHL